MKKVFKLPIAIITSLTLAFSPLTTFASVTVQDTTPQASIANESYSSKYLKNYFGISLSEDFNENEYLNALSIVLSKSGAVSANPDAKLKFSSLVASGLKNAGFLELARTYSEEKAKTILQKHKLDLDINGELLQNVACALEIGMISDEDASLSLENVAVDSELASDVLFFIAYTNGNANNFIGYSDETDIYAKVYNAYKQGSKLKNDKLFSIGAEAVKRKASTGFNLKNDNYAANFLPELTLVYGHSSIEHAKQLLALLESENIVAKVQLEPKESIFEYLLEWGPIPEPSEYYWIETISDNFFLAHSYEYDLVLEFETVAEKDLFDKVINTNAKKNSDNPDKIGLIVDSWWQPLYTSETKMKEGYHLIYDNVISSDGFSIHPFSLPENRLSFIKTIESIDTKISVTPKPIYCNSAFYRYLNGDFE